MVVADGEIELPYDKKTTEDRTRYAPSFVAGGSSRHGRHDHPYSPRSVAKVIGWVAPDGRAQHKVHVALNALELMEQGYLKIEDFADLTTTEAGGLTKLVQRVVSITGNPDEQVMRARSPPACS